MTTQNRYTLSIFGEDYNIVSDEDSEALSKAAGMVDDLMKSAIPQETHASNRYKPTVLVAMQLASQLLEARACADKLEKSASSLVDLIKKETGLS